MKNFLLLVICLFIASKSIGQGLNIDSWSLSVNTTSPGNQLLPGTDQTSPSNFDYIPGQKLYDKRFSDI